MNLGMRHGFAPKTRRREYREVVVGDIVFSSEISNNHTLKVMGVGSKMIEVVIVGEETLGSFRIKKKDAVFWDEGLQDKLESLYERRSDAEDDVYDINLEMDDINERFVGCE